MALDVYLTGQVQDHLCACVRSVTANAHQMAKTVGSRHSTRAGTIAEVEVRRIMVDLGGRSETPHIDAGRELLRVGRLSLGG